MQIMTRVRFFRRRTKIIERHANSIHQPAPGQTSYENISHAVVDCLEVTSANEIDKRNRENKTKWKKNGTKR